MNGDIHNLRTGFIVLLAFTAILVQSSNVLGAIVLSPVIGEKAVDEEKEVYSISKCCKMNETYDKDGKCHPDSTPFTPEFYGPEPDTVDIIEGLTCDYGSYRLYPEEDENDEFHLLTNGSLYLPNMEVVTQLVPPGSYCLENFTSTDGHSELLALLCFPSPVAGFQWKKAAMTLYSIGCLFSVPFLALTSIVYWWVQALSDVRGRVLATHTACLMVAFIFLVYVQTMGADLPHVPCVIVAFFIQFSFLASFFWLNVLCIHTWRQVRLSERQTPTTAGSEKKSYVRYSMYAWSVPVFILVLSLALEFSPFASQTVVKPNFGVNSCWFHTNAGAAVLFYGPIAFVLLANLVFFGLIAKILWRNDIRSGMTTGEMKRLAWTAIRSIRMKTFKECVVLFCVMGLNWMMELISWGLGGPIALWLLTDIVNTLQGPIIFYLFVWRDETTRRHAKKLFCECKWRRKKRLPQTPPQPGSIAAGLLPAPTELKTFAVKETTPMSFSNAVLEVLKPPESTKNEMPAI